MFCEACGSAIELVSAQTRAADEGRTFTLTCPSCPLDASKFSSKLSTPHIYMPRRKRQTKSTPIVSNATFRSTYQLRVRVSKSFDEEKLEMFSAMSCTVVGEDSNIFRYYFTGPYSGKCVREGTYSTVAPLSTLVQCRAADIDEVVGTQYVAFRYANVSTYTYINDTTSRYIVADLEDDSVECICSAIQEIYTLGFEPLGLRDAMKDSTLGALSNLTSRGYDRSDRLPEGYLYTTKPNGERIWIVRIGLVWMGTRRLTGHLTVFWTIDGSIERSAMSTIGPCIDVELMHLHPPIFIDVLMNETGQASSQQRNIEWSLAEVVRLQQLFDYLSILHVRRYFESLDEAEDYRVHCGYPTDGLVAIHKSGTDMFKIKAVKSIELLLSENGKLLTEEGTELLQIESPVPYKTGSVVEVNFEVIDNQMKIHGHFFRPDKRTANKLDVVGMIVESAIPPRESDILRNRLWRWSNMVRTSLYKKAHRMCHNKQIVIDVGTGTGQSVESFIEGKSYILIEPDAAKCRQLARRLGVKYDSIQTDPRSIVPQISRLNRGQGKYHILNTTLEVFLSDRVIINNIRGLVGCCISSFSAHFVIESLDILKNECNIPFIGSCYVYDGVSPGQSIIDSHGISMKRISQDKAVVTWGRDTPYEEPAREVSSFPADTLIIDAIDEVSYASEGPTDPGRIAAQHMKILIYT